MTIELNLTDDQRLLFSAEDVGMTPEDFAIDCIRGELDRFDFDRWYSRHPVGKAQYKKPFGRELMKGEHERIRKMIRNSFSTYHNDNNIDPLDNRG